MLKRKSKTKKGKIPNQSPPTPEETIKRKEKLLKRIIDDTIFKAAFIIVIFSAAFTLVFGITTVETNDMYPAVRQGDIAIYYRLAEPMNSDIVLYDTGDKTRIGRVQATEGTSIDKTKGGKITMDGNLQPKQERLGLYYETYASDSDKMIYPSQVPTDSYFVLGDCRQESKDSRLYGYINKSNIKGKVFTILRRRTL